MRPYSAVPELPTTRRCTCERNCCALNSTRPEIPAALGDVEQHLADVGLLPVARRVLVQLVDEHDDVLHAEVALLEVLAQLRDDAREDQILRVLLETRRRRSRTPCGPESSRTGGRSTAPSSVTSPSQRSEMFESRLRTLRIVATWWVRQLWSSFFSSARSTSRNQASRSANDVHRVRAARASDRRTRLSSDVLLDEVDQRVGLRVDVVLVEQHLGVLQHLAQSPRERRDVVEQRLVRAQRVERHAVRLVRREVLRRSSNGSGGDAALLVERAVRVVDLAGLVEEAEVGALHVEADRGDAPLLRREVREDRLQQPLHGARLRRQTGDAGDVQVRRLGADEEVGVEVDRRSVPPAR